MAGRMKKQGIATDRKRKSLFMGDSFDYCPRICERRKKTSLENELLESNFSGNMYREVDLVCQVGENGCPHISTSALLLILFGFHMNSASQKPGQDRRYLDSQSQFGMPVPFPQTFAISYLIYFGPYVTL